MNIFFLDRDPYLAASYLHDKHVVKMISESCQLLSVWASKYEGDHKEELTDLPWTKLSHQNHPCALWLDDRLGNVQWLARHLDGLLYQYLIRFKNRDNFERAREIRDKLLPWFNHWVWVFMGTPPQCMPEEYQVPGGLQCNAVEAYREYYRKEKLPARYTEPSSEPAWVIPPPSAKELKVPPKKKFEFFKAPDRTSLKGMKL